MRIRKLLKATTVGVGLSVFANVVLAADFNVPAGDLKSALDVYAAQTGTSLIVSSDEVHGARTKGVKGQFSADAALTRILAGTGFSVFRYSSGAIGISREKSSEIVTESHLELAQAAAPKASVETVTVTSSKLGGADVQSIPIAITALSQEQLTATQTAGGPDLIKNVPNMTFTKTNFSGYSIQIRGIGTQAVSVTTDPAVAVALNDIPFIRNHFFEQEFYDLSQAEVLRGPQGTLYGRNATAGVVNLITAKPTDQFEAMASGDIGNYKNRRFEGMINLPIVDDRADLRIAGEWTKRDGYSFNEITNSPIDGRNLWSGRVTLGFKPIQHLQTYLIWEHFQENDDRLRSSKQLCKTAPTPTEVGGVLVATNNFHVENPNLEPSNYLSQGCEQTSLYSADAYQLPNAFALPYATDIAVLNYFIRPSYNPYTSTTQSRDLRVIQSAINPTYRARNDTLELNADYDLTPELTLTSQTGYNSDFLWSTEDYNRFNTGPGFFFMGVFQVNNWQANAVSPDPSGAFRCAALDGGGDCNGKPAGASCDPAQGGQCIQDAVFCDPQLGCSSRLVAEDLSEEHAWQFSHEFRLSSKYSGPFNFSVGGNFLHYETEENYYVFINSLTLSAASTLGGSPGPGQQAQWIPGVSDNSQCLIGGFVDTPPSFPHNPLSAGYCAYIDPNPITSLNNKGHNYFLSQNPYVLNSYAGFGEAYYNLTQELKLTGGLRWTDDEKHFIDIPSELAVPGYGYAATAVVNQKWDQWTGRAAANWTPKLEFTDQTLVYGSYAHGYKAGGANPPGATFLTYGGADVSNPIHPLTFKPEFVDAFELGTKNTLLDGALTLNGDVFYYNYENYQISRIVDRTAINDNFDAYVRGGELEASWEPLPGLKFNFAGGYEDARLANGSHSVDLIDRTAGNPDWMVLKPFPTQASNCIVPVYVVAAILNQSGTTHGIAYACGNMYNLHEDPLTEASYVQDPTVQNAGTVIPPDYPGYDPLSVDSSAPANVNNGLGLPPNNGEGFDKDLSGNDLPNAPHFTTSFSAEYTHPLTPDWAATLHGDFYWQSDSFARVFNDRPYDELHGYTNLNIALILTSQNGWQVMGYLKNVFNTTAITGDFLNSDDSGLTTNVFLTDPRLFGVRVTKNW